MKKEVAEKLPNPVRVFVLWHRTNGYFCGQTKGYQYWSRDLNDARTWKRLSDVTNSQRKSNVSSVLEAKVTPITFTHGFQAIN